MTGCSVQKNGCRSTQHNFPNVLQNSLASRYVGRSVSIWTVYLFSHSCQPADGLLCHNMFCCWCAVSQLLCVTYSTVMLLACYTELVSVNYSSPCGPVLIPFAVHGTGVCEESCLHPSLSDDLHRHVVPIWISCSNHVLGSVSASGNARIVVCLFSEGNLYHSRYSVCLLWILFYFLTQNLICIFFFLKVCWICIKYQCVWTCPRLPWHE